MGSSPNFAYGQIPRVTAEQWNKLFTDKQDDLSGVSDASGFGFVTNDTTLAGDSAALVATEHAVKTYVDGQKVQQPGAHQLLRDLDNKVLEVRSILDTTGVDRNGSECGAALQNAIDDAEAQGSPLALYVPSGTYLSNQQLQMAKTGVPIVLFSDHHSGATLKAGASISSLLRMGPDAGSTIRPQGVAIRGIKLDGNAHCSGAVLDFYNLLYFGILGLRIENGANTGIYGHGNPDVSGTSGDPYCQGGLVQDVEVHGCAGVGHYYRGVKGSRFIGLDSDANATGYFWEREHYTSGGAATDEITENVISTCRAANCTTHGFEFSGVAKHDVSNIEAYICQGTAFHFRPPSDSVNGDVTDVACSFSNLMARNCNSYVEATGSHLGSGMQFSNINAIGIHPSGTLGGSVVRLPGWYRYTVDGVMAESFDGVYGISIEDSPTGDHTNFAIVKTIVLIGGSPTTTGMNGVSIAGHTGHARVKDVTTDAAAGSSGYEVIVSGTNMNDVSLDGLDLTPNAAGHEISITNGADVSVGGTCHISGNDFLAIPRVTAPGTLPFPINGMFIDASDGLPKLRKSDGILVTFTTS